MAIKILDVGQCGFDGPRMAALWRDKLGATVIDSGSGDDALRQVQKGNADVVLVNRVLADDGSSGLDVVRAVVETGVPVMLVSDLEEAQDEAVALGALRGFGKADLGEKATLDLVAEAARKK